MKRLNSFSRFMSEVMERGEILRIPNPEPRTPIQTQYVSLAALLPRTIMSAVILALMLITTLWFTPQSHAQVIPGDTLVIDEDAGTGDLGALLSVNPSTGNRTLINDFGDSSQGSLEDNPFGAATISPQPRLGDILVIDLDAGADPTSAGNTPGALFSINPFDGTRLLISDFGMSAQGPLGFDPRGAVIDASGNLLVVDDDGGTNGSGALFRVNPTNGNRTLVSDFGNSAQGSLGVDPSGVALEASSNILVTDVNAGTNGRGALFRVNPSNGSRTLISDFGNGVQGALGSRPSGVALDAPGNILVIDFSAGTNFGGALFRVNPANGNRTILSDFGNMAQGVLGISPFGMTLDASGNILVIDADAGTDSRGALFGVNPSGGNRIVLSDFGDPSKGISGSEPFGVSVFTVKCGGLSTTRISNSFDNTINGTAGLDVIHGLGGKDTINGLGGNDVICSGSGNDTLNGGPGTDKLFGEVGLDTLNGGTGTDTCDGGTQSDTATGCETRTNIP